MLPFSSGLREFEHRTPVKGPWTGPLLLEKANEFAQKLGLQLKTDSVSRAWIDRFKERHSISFRAVSGESGAVDLATVENWLKKVWPSIQADYKPEDIFNADECGLFSRCFRKRPWL